MWAALLGAALPLAYAPFDLWWLAPLLLAGLWALWDGQNSRDAAWTGFVFGTAQFLAGTYWLYISIHVFGGAPLVLAVGLMFAVVLIMAAYFALTGWLAARLAPESGALRWWLVLPATWLVVEWLRGWLFSGFGWLALGYSQTDSPLGGWAPVGGLYLVTLAVLISASALRVLAAPGVGRIVAPLVLVAVWGGGALFARVEFTTPVGEPVSIALAQGSVPQDLKWAPEQFETTLQLYSGLTERALDHDLIIWPEAAIPALAHQVDSYLRAIRGLAAEGGATVLLGILRYDFDLDQYENTLLALTDEPEYYVKHHLVPFGEYFPVPAWVRNWMRLMNLPYTDIAAGPANQPPLEVAGQRLAVSICYEDLFGAKQLHYYPDATLLVNVSNDAWFGDSIAPHQHLQIARLRAMESRRWMARSTNTGVSAMIDPFGAVPGASPQFETYLLSGEAQGRTGHTPYTRTGNAPLVTLAFFALLACAWRRRP